MDIDGNLFLHNPTGQCKFTKGLCLTFENETGVGPGDNLVQLIKAHSLHTSFAVFEKNRNFIITRGPPVSTERDTL